MRRILVQQIELRHLLEDLREARSRIALVGDEQQPGVVFETLMPGAANARR